MRRGVGKTQPRQQSGRQESMKLQEENQELASDIAIRSTRISKKRQRIDQESKDKQIIHIQLVKAQKAKEEREIKASTQSKQQKVHQHPSEAKEGRLSAEAKKESLAESKPQQPSLDEKPLNLKKIQQQSIHKQNSKTLKKEQQANSAPEHSFDQPKLKLAQEAHKQKPSQAPVMIKPATIETGNFGNSDKGDYQPPALFLDSEDDEDEEEEEDNSKALQILRSKLRLAEKELHDNEDED